MRTQDRLLDAHVAFVLRDLTGASFAALVRNEIDWVLDRAEKIVLDDVVDREAVTAVAVKYATRANLAGAIPDLVGEITARFRAHPANERPLSEVLPRARAEAFAHKIAELQPLRRRIAAVVAESPVVQTWLAGYLRSIALWPVATNRRLAGRVPGVNRALALGERVGGRVAAGALIEADLRSRELAESAAATLLAQWGSGLADGISDGEFAEALLTVWDRMAERPVRELLDAGDDAHLIDVVVLVFETWLELRDGDYVPALIRMGVDYFFGTYGSYPLSELLTEFGVSRSDLVEEALRFGPRALTALAANGDLEVFVRRQLSRFYDSPEARAALGDPAGGVG
jgi:hypothetical protein